MKLFKKIVFATLAGTLVLSGCGNNEEVAGDKKPAKVVEKNKEIKQNLLTGEDTLTEKAIGKRPVAVMVNNVEPAMPQYGVEQADVIFEIPVEGDLTRFMALYGDYTQVPEICPVRSCRYYFPVISQGFDAFYIHWGMDETVRSYIEDMGVERFDGMVDNNGLFGRDQSRLDAGYSLEHTAYFDGTKLSNVLEKEYRLDLKEEYKKPAFKFNKKQKAPSEEACTMVDIDFGSQGSTFVYDAEKNVYLKQINGNAQIDAKTNNQLAFNNVFVLETPIQLRSNGVHQNVDCFGGDDSVGYYISNGAIQKIHWKKEDVNARLKFYNEEGKEIKINKGKTYIALNYPGQATYE